ncbi:hypothetical protein ACFU96_48250 [Streptomyces sp. NPDC057620]|uniref:hypothetical protein n=1 Tax=Streptomyces sp. NPDC057620 TaxID=3346185 RepID=UPI0036753747
MNQPDPTTDPETARLHDEILTGRAEIAQLRDLLGKEGKRADDAIDRETTAEQAAEEAQEGARRALEQRQQMAGERYALQEERDRLRERVADYENRITWHTTCASCARILDSSIQATEQTEAYRLALSEALGLGNGAPWDAIQGRASELAVLAAPVVPPAPTSRTACVCGQPSTPDVFHRQDGPCYQITPVHRMAATALARVDAHSWADGVPLEEQAVWQDYLLRAAAVLAVLPNAVEAAAPAAAEERPTSGTCPHCKRWYVTSEPGAHERTCPVKAATEEQPESETPCGPTPDACDGEAGEPCANHEREAAHAEGEHCFCGPECQQPKSETEA